MKYTVREPHNYELDKLVDIVKNGLAESPTYCRLSFDHEKMVQHVASAILKQHGWFIRVIATEDEDEPVGGLMGYSEELVFSTDKIASDIVMVVAKEHRGRCTRAFIQCIEDFRAWALSDEKVKIIKLGVSSGMKIDAVSNVLERLGFVRIGAMHAHLVGV